MVLVALAVAVAGEEEQTPMKRVSNGSEAGSGSGIAFCGALTDYPKDLEALQKLPFTEENRVEIAKVFYEWAAADPVAALQRANEEKDPAWRNELIAGMVGPISFRDLHLSLRLLAQTPDKASRALAIRSFARCRASVNLPETLEWVANFTDEQERAIAYRSLVGSWSEKDPTAAASYYVKQGTEQDRECLRQTLQIWGKSDPVKAIAWLNDPPVSLAGNAYSEVIVAASDANPRLAVVAALSIDGDPFVKAAVVRAAFAAWKTASPQDAEEFLSRLPESEVKRGLQSPK
jgi:hypothetical protein